MSVATDATVSVIIPVYNCERYLAAAIDSVLGQSLVPDEVIVVDDGSTDGTASVLASFGRRIIVHSQANQGGAEATNRGIANARGRFLCFLDADDLWVRDKLAWQMNWLAAHPETEAVFGYVRQFVSEELDPAVTRHLAAPPEPQPGLSKIAMTIRRAAFDRVGNFDGSLRSTDFIEWYGRALDWGLRTHMLSEIVAHRRLHLANNGTRIRDSQRAENLAVIKRALDRRRS